MRDVTAEIRTEQYRTALRQYADLFKKHADTYVGRSIRATDTGDRDRYDGVAEGLLMAGDALASAAEWDTPDRPDRWPLGFPLGPDALSLPERES